MLLVCVLIDLACCLFALGTETCCAIRVFKKLFLALTFGVTGSKLLETCDSIVISSQKYRQKTAVRKFAGNASGFTRSRVSGW